MGWTATVKPLEEPTYAPLTSITRCLHLRDAVRCYSKRKLIPHKINSPVVDINSKVLWFAPTTSMSENNFYGNVSFTLDWKVALASIGSNLYYLDQEKTPTHIYTRVLLTGQSHGHHLSSVKVGEQHPMIINGNDFYAAVQYLDGASRKIHILEVGIEVDAAKAKWLFSNCKIQTNNHSLANSSLNRHIERGVCHRFNTFGRKCPSAYNKETAEGYLNARCPGMLQRMMTPVVTGECSFEENVCDEKPYEEHEYEHDYDDHERSNNTNGDVISYSADTVYRTLVHDSSWEDEDGAYGGVSRCRVVEPSYQVFTSSASSSRQTEDDEWTTAQKVGVGVGVAVGAVALIAGLSALFGEEKKSEKKEKKWYEQ